MKRLSKLQYTVIFLYSKGLTFKEIDRTLTTASRGVYSQVVAKDKGRVTRAKTARKTNLNGYKIELKNKIDEVKKHNREISKYSNGFMKKYLVDEKLATQSFKLDYINKSLDFANRSYSRYSLTLLKKRIENATV